MKREKYWAQNFLRQFLFANKCGSSLVEVLLLIGIFSLLSVGVVSTLLTSSQAAKQGMEYVVAAGYMEEGIQAVRSIRDRDFTEVVNGTHGLTTTSGYYEFSGTAESLDGGVYTRTITIEDVYRASGLSSDIAVSGTVDDNAKKVTVNLVWDVFEGRTQNIDSVFYVMNWGVRSWLQTLDTEFAAGIRNSTAITVSGNGEVTLQSADAEWAGITPQHEIDLDGNGSRIALWYDESQDYLYVLSEATIGNEFLVMDVGSVSTTTPTELRGIDFSGFTATDFVIANGYAYVSTNWNSGEVVVVRLSDMVQVNTIDLAGNEDANDVAITGNTLVIVRNAGTNEEIYYYDIATPEGTLTELGSTEIGSDLVDVEVTSTHVFAGSTNNTNELYVIRLSDYTQINTVDMTDTDDVSDMELVGSNLYVARQDGFAYDFAVFDVSDPSSIGTPQTIELGTLVNAIAIDRLEEYAALATPDNNQELIIVDLNTFTVEQVYDTSGGDDGKSVEIYGAYLFFGEDSTTKDIEIFTSGASGWTFPTQVAAIDKAGTHDAIAIDIEGDYAYLTTLSNADELYIYDISTPSSPTLLGALDVGADVYGIDVEGDYAYLATAANNRELDVIDVSTKTSPVRVGSLDLTQRNDAFSVSVSGNYAYIGRDAGREEEFFVIDISTPSSPFEVGAYEFGEDINAVVVSGSYVFAATDSNSAELAVFDVSTPASPSFVGSYDLPGADNGQSVAVYNTLVGIGRSGNDEFALFDVTTPASPSLYTEVSIGSAVNALAFVDEHAVFLGVDGTGVELQRWDISTPALPVLVFEQDCGGDVRGLFYDGTLIHAATEEDGTEYQIYGPSVGASDYAPEGTFTSQAFDSEDAGTNWTSMEWTASGTGSVEFRIRTAETEANLEGATWVGSDGTETTTYTTSGQAIVEDPAASGTQWIQWKAYLYGNRITAPVLEDVTLYY